MCAVMLDFAFKSLTNIQSAATFHSNSGLQIQIQFQFTIHNQNQSPVAGNALLAVPDQWPYQRIRWLISHSPWQISLACPLIIPIRICVLHRISLTSYLGQMRPFDKSSSPILYLSMSSYSQTKINNEYKACLVLRSRFGSYWSEICN